MQKRTRSLLEELESMHQERDSRLIIETRARNLIDTAADRGAYIDQSQSLNLFVAVPISP